MFMRSFGPLPGRLVYLKVSFRFTFPPAANEKGEKWMEINLFRDRLLTEKESPIKSVIRNILIVGIESIKRGNWWPAKKGEQQEDLRPTRSEIEGSKRKLDGASPWWCFCCCYRDWISLLGGVHFLPQIGNVITKKVAQIVCVCVCECEKGSQKGKIDKRECGKKNISIRRFRKKQTANCPFEGHKFNLFI